MKNKLNLVLFAAIIFLASCGNEEQVRVTVDWSDVECKIDAKLWGVNDFKVKNFIEPDEEYKAFMHKLNPAIVRIHHSGIVKDSWSDDENKTWDIERINATMKNAFAGYSPNTKVMVCFSECPGFISENKKYIEPGKHQAAIDLKKNIKS